MHGNQKMGTNGNTAKEVYNFTKNPKPCSSLKIGVECRVLKMCTRHHPYEYFCPQFQAKKTFFSISLKQTVNSIFYFSKNVPQIWKKKNKRCKRL